MAMQTPGLETSPAAPAPAHNHPRRVPIVLLIVLLIGVVTVIGSQVFRRDTTPPRSGPAPEFTMPLYGGDEFVLADQRGSIVVLNFWGSWCAPCRDEAAELQAIHERYAERGVRLIGVNFRDVEARALAFIDEFRLTYPNGIDLEERISTDYYVGGAPETFIIDRDGSIHDFFLGQVTYAQLSASLDRLLAGDTGR